MNEMAANRGNCYAHLFRPVSIPTMRPDSMSESGLKYTPCSRPLPKCWHSQLLLSRSLVGSSSILSEARKDVG